MKVSTLKEYPFLVISLLVVCCNAIIFQFTRFHYLGWDESVYLSMGRYVATSGKYGLWESIRPPLLPLILAPFSLTKEYILASEMIILMFTLGVVILTYLITKNLYNKKTAAIAVMILSFTPLFLFNATQILTGIPALFFVLLALYLFIQGRLFLSGIITAAAFLTRFPAGIFLIALLIILVINRKPKKKYFQVLSGASLPIILFFIINIILYQHETATLFDAALRPFLFAAKHQFNPLHTQTFLFYPLTLLKSFPLFLLSLLPLITLSSSLPLIWRGFKKEKQNQKQTRTQKKSLLPVIPLIPLLLFLTYFTIITNKQLRFATLFIPFIVMYAAQGMLMVYEKCKQQNAYSKLLAPTVIIFIIASGIVASIDIQKNMRFFPEDDSHSQEFSFFKNNNINNARILTTNPRFAIQSNNLFIPMYDDVEAAKRIYEAETYDYLIYDHAFFPCIEISCKKSKEALKQQILVQNEVVAKKEMDIHIVKAISKVI
jgi:4-amino-4-deoxy-L-arabinose transferase-like glycosyltransferase